MRIWVTGLGMVTPLGRTAPATMDALLAGERAFEPLTLFDPSGCRSSIAAQIPNLHPSDVAPPGADAGWSRTDAMAVIAAREALAEVDPAAPVDLILGGTTAGMFETEHLLAEMFEDPAARQPLESMLSHPLSATVDRMQSVVRRFERSRTICSACSSGANALLLAAAWLRTGRSERVLAGGADGLCRLTFTGFSCLGALSPDPCRPFDVNRNGLNLGEGAAFLLLETEAAARERGVSPIAELRGWAVASEAHHITNPEASGRIAAQVMRGALARAGLGPEHIDYINAHGTATKLNDQMEARAIRDAFGEHGERIGVSSTKGQMGHTLGAAGAIEAAILALAIGRSAIPPTAGLVDVDPACVLNHVHEARSQVVRAAMSNSFGFGGSDAAIVIADATAFDSPPGLLGDRRVVITGGATLGGLGLRDASDSSVYLEPGPGPDAGALTFDASEHLDVARARRIDRAGRFAAAAVSHTLARARLEPDPEGHDRVGAIIGAAYGSVDACAQFIHRVLDKGARMASPAVFPNLLPSSPVAHASIYNRLRGAVFSSADLDATSVGAMVTAYELLIADEADAMLAGGVEEVSPITEAVLGPLCSTTQTTPVERSEGAVALLLEDRAFAAQRGAAILAEVVWAVGWRGDPGGRIPHAPPAPKGDALVVVDVRSEHVASCLRGTAWEHVEVLAATPRAGAHECAGGFAAAAALGPMAERSVEVLVLGLAPDRGYALLLRGADAAP